MTSDVWYTLRYLAEQLEQERLDCLGRIDEIRRRAGVRRLTSHEQRALAYAEGELDRIEQQLDSLGSR